MQKNISIQMEQISPDLNLPEWTLNYPEKKFAIYSTCFLSTSRNSHELEISEDVLRNNASSILGNFLVGKISEYANDLTTHAFDEIIFGYFPKEQEIVFEEENRNGRIITKACAYAVISKQYGKSFNDIFTNDNLRNTSVEMTVVTDENDENKVLSFDIFGLTCLGKTVNGSCPDANMSMVRFSRTEAEKFFKENTKNSSLDLHKFAQERKDILTKKTYKIDKSKEALSDKDWGKIDKSDLRNKIMEATNRNSLVKAVYLLVEKGWEDAPSEHLKYPVMELDGDTFKYNRNALSSALGYAKKENEDSVVKKIEKIYKNLGIDNEGKDGDSKMAEIEFAAVNIGDMWGNLYTALHDRYPDGEWDSVYRIDNIFEEDNKKFAIIHRKDEENKYRLDFTLTEEGLTLADEITKVEIEVIETDVVRKFAEPENVSKYREFAKTEDKKVEAKNDDKNKEEFSENTNEGDSKEEEVEDSSEEEKEEDESTKMEEKSESEKMLEDKITKLEKDVSDRDAIIMEKDNELKELREFKEKTFADNRDKVVSSTMAEVKSYLDDCSYNTLLEEGKVCKFEEINGWVNKVKAVSFDSSKKNQNKKLKQELWFASTTVEHHGSNSLWD